MNRRDFLKHSSLASGALMIPQFLNANALGSLHPSRSGKALVVLQLTGGNDGLNTIIPFENDIYYDARPRLSIPKKEVIKVSETLGFHPQFASIRELFEDGEMTIINNIGYPDPDRSHFRSMDIWQTGSDADVYLSTGWLGRYLDNECNNCSGHTALEMDDTLSLTLKGVSQTGFAMNDAKRLKKTAGNRYLKAIARHHHDHDHDDNVAYLYRTMISTQESADYLFQKSKAHSSKINYPDSKFADSLKKIAELMTADADIKIYYAELGGFDTHAGQNTRQPKLLQTYAEAVNAFVKDLKRNGLFDDTLILTFSEFGRRVKQNASNGTDHGKANNLYLMGGKLKQPGFYNEGPDLKNLDDGDLQFQIDFRRVYADILNNWLEADDKKILGKKFETLGII